LQERSTVSMAEHTAYFCRDDLVLGRERINVL
jgi:hypothetical protein